MASSANRERVTSSSNFLSHGVVKRERRKWEYSEVAKLVVVVALHFLCVWLLLRLLGLRFGSLSGYIVTGLFGITFSFHRNLTHRSFKLPKWLEYFCAYCGLHALQGHPIDWVGIHRQHHQYSDTERDPHSPIQGFLFSHISWIFDNKSYLEKCGKAKNVADLEKQWFYRFLRMTHIVHPVALGALLYAVGGYPYIVWGMGVRTVWVHHITWLVNSACHIWGKPTWNTAMVAFGEGWHNNHHAFEYSARHGLEWWQFDITWYLIGLLQSIGLATHVKLPTTAHKQRMAHFQAN